MSKPTRAHKRPVFRGVFYLFFTILRAFFVAALYATGTIPGVLNYASLPDPHTSVARDARARRLIVLIPSMKSGLNPATANIAALAGSAAAGVELIGLYRTASEEPGLRRQLIAMGILLGGVDGIALAQTVHVDRCVNLVCDSWQPGDLVVCVGAPRRGIFGGSISRSLERRLSVEVMHLPGQEDLPVYVRAARQGAAWVGGFAIILGFFWLQARIGAGFPAQAAVPFWLLSIVLEAWALWYWNDLFER